MNNDMFYKRVFEGRFGPKIDTIEKLVDIIAIYDTTVMVFRDTFLGIQHTMYDIVELLSVKGLPFKFYKASYEIILPNRSKIIARWDGEKTCGYATNFHF
jgi:hypothetical protein